MNPVQGALRNPVPPKGDVCRDSRWRCSLLPTNSPCPRGSKRQLPTRRAISSHCLSGPQHGRAVPWLCRCPFGIGQRPVQALRQRRGVAGLMSGFLRSLRGRFRQRPQERGSRPSVTACMACPAARRSFPCWFRYQPCSLASWTTTVDDSESGFDGRCPLAKRSRCCTWDQCGGKFRVIGAVTAYV